MRVLAIATGATPRRHATACITHHDGLCAPMVTVLRAEDLRVIIFLDDHQLAHVHVFGDGQARIGLLGADGMTRGEIRRAMRIVMEQQALLLVRWEDIHGRID